MFGSQLFERFESQVRTYCRNFSAVFVAAEGTRLVDENGVSYLDFLSGAGTLNYGHNPRPLINDMIEYMSRAGVLHGLDLHTSAKRRFIDEFVSVILAPRQLDHVLQFVGPTGTDCVEAAIRLARKVTRRDSIVAFTNAFHGMTSGSLALSTPRRDGIPDSDGVVRLPFDGFVKDSLGVIEAMLGSPGSGLPAPAAIILECVQGEGGLNVASEEWLRGVERIARRIGALLIVDEIQTGCGRTGSFFAFESSGIHPDLICLSKSLSGCGLPMSLVLISRELDQWAPGEHSGTFRGNNLAFVSASRALDYWRDDALMTNVAERSAELRKGLQDIVARYPELELELVGTSLMSGLRCKRAGVATKLSRRAFERRLIVETCGHDDSVLKLLPPLVLDRSDIEEALHILDHCAAELAGELAGSFTAPERVRSLTPHCDR